MYIYYKIKQKKMSLIGTSILLLFGIGAGIFYTYAVYVDELNLWETIHTIAQQDIEMLERVINYVVVNIGLVQMLWIIIGILASTRTLWVKLFDKNLSYFLDDFRYMYYAILQYLGVLLFITFCCVGGGVLFANYEYFVFAITSFLGLSSVFVAIVLLIVYTSNFMSIITELKLAFFYAIVVIGFALAFTFAQTPIGVNGILCLFFIPISLVTHLGIIYKIRRNRYVTHK